MKMKNVYKITALLLVCILGLFTACGSPMGEESYDNGDITVDYLRSEYSEMLLTDGAEHLIGSIELSTAEDGSPQIILHPKEAASEANDDGTYTVSSYAINRILYLSDSAYATFGDSEAILDGSGFLNTVPAGFDDSIMYDVYALDDQILLILSNPSYVLPEAK
ncbi:MAG: hypothetical protein IJM99_09760 [Firmicutes bacterium]|nr:hypothetical protein [Bacillota bacterium]